ncbi:MAG: peptide-methionine (R)-S-oxide reductase [Pseudomonadota bacterium]
MEQSKTDTLSRRRFFGVTGAVAVTVGTAASARVPARLSDDTFSYEVNRTDEEWVAMLRGDEYAILREGYTEKPKSSPLWQETRPGTYHCKGCDLKSFDGRWKRELDKGWVFFYHADPNAILTDIDGPTPDYGSMAAGKDAVTEVHCRRCGSHLGHLLIVEGEMTHCINGAALNFSPEVS